jgi:hypothetical protein
MAQSKTEATCIDLLRQFSELKLDLNRLKPRILDGDESTTTTPLPHHADGLDGHRVDHDYGLVFPHNHIPANGMNQYAPPHLDVDHTYDFPHHSCSHMGSESVRASQGRLPIDPFSCVH